MKNQKKKMKTGFATQGAKLCVILTLLSSCMNQESKNSDHAQGDSATEGIKPTGPKPAWAPDIAPEMQAVLEKLGSYNDRPIPELTPQEARKNHTPTDAVIDLIKENNLTVPPSKVETRESEIPAGSAKIPVRIYMPKGDGPFPVVVYYHGGGFVIADLDVYDSSARAIAEQANCVVVSVAYRLAPENKFPTAHNDSFAAYEWVVKNTGSLKGDASQIAVVGESAGGNLALNMAIMARDKGIKLPIHVLCVYPIAQSDMNTPSYQKYAEAKPLDKPMMAWFTKHYLNNAAEAKDPRISLVEANLKGLPPTTIITAEIDPLQSDGIMIADKLKAAGVKVVTKNYDGVAHEFFGMAAVVPQAKEAQAFAAKQLNKAFGK